MAFRRGIFMLYKEVFVAYRVNVDYFTTFLFTFFILDSDEDSNGGTSGKKEQSKEMLFAITVAFIDCPVCRLCTIEGFQGRHINSNIRNIAELRILLCIVCLKCISFCLFKTR